MTMRLTAKSILTALAAQGAWSWEHASSTGFRSALSDNERYLVAFLGPPTDAARLLEPEWNAISEPSTSKLSVDCVAESSLCSELDVVSFPTIRLYHRGGGMHRYRGPRKTKSIDAFLKRMSSPLVAEIDGDNMKSFIESDDLVFVAQLAAGSGDDETKFEERLLEMTERHQDRFTVGIAAGIAEQNLLQCYNNIDAASFQTAELDTFASIEAFVKKCSAPLIPELTRRNEMEYMSSGKSLVYYFSPSATDREEWTATTRALARKFAQYLTFVTVDSAAYPEMVTGLGIAGEAAGVGLSVSNPRMGQIFPMGDPGSGPAAARALEAFITEVSQGRVEPWDGVMRDEEASKTAGEKPHDEL